MKNRESTRKWVNKKVMLLFTLIFYLSILYVNRLKKNITDIILWLFSHFFSLFKIIIEYVASCDYHVEYYSVACLRLAEAY
jgi:hypothetical protein